MNRGVKRRRSVHCFLCLKAGTTKIMLSEPTYVCSACFQKYNGLEFLDGTPDEYARIADALDHANEYPYQTLNVQANIIGLVAHLREQRRAWNKRVQDEFKKQIRYAETLGFTNFEASQVASAFWPQKIVGKTLLELMRACIRDTEVLEYVDILEYFIN